MDDVYCFLDCETTGVSPYDDRIIEITIVRSGDPYGDPVERLAQRVFPDMPIPESATEIHGITDADVVDCPYFAQIAEDVEKILRDDPIIVGYNSRSFDIPLIDAELRRCGSDGLPKDDMGVISTREVDLFLVWRECEKRTLVTAIERFVGKEHEQAHSSEADTDILPDLMSGMALDFKIDLEKMQEITAPADVIDRDGKFKKDDNGKVVFAFGKHDGDRVAANIGYIQWMVKQDFPPDTKAWCREFLRLDAVAKAKAKSAQESGSSAGSL